MPVIADDGVIVFESPAIALYLTDRFPQNHLGPQVGDPGRGTYRLVETQLLHRRAGTRVHV